MDGDGDRGTHTQAAYAVTIGHHDRETVAWRNEQAKVTGHLRVDKCMSRSRVDLGLELDTANHHLQQHGISRPEAGEGVEEDLQVGNHVAQGVLHAVFKLQEEDALAAHL